MNRKKDTHRPIKRQEKKKAAHYSYFKLPLRKNMPKCAVLSPQVCRPIFLQTEAARGAGAA